MMVCARRRFWFSTRHSALSDPFDVLNDQFLGRAELEGRVFTGVAIDRRMRAAGQLTGARSYLAYEAVSTT